MRTGPDITPRGLWEATASPAPLLHPLLDKVTSDVVIIGAGVTGLSAALELAAGGADVVVLEADQIGSGAVGKSSGLINAGMWMPPDELRRTLGTVHGERLLAALGEAPKHVFSLIEKHRIACDPEPAGTLHCAVGSAGQKMIEERAGSWQRIGADVVLLDQEQTARRVGSSYFTGALLDNRTGTVQPLSYVRGLAMAAIAAGARLFAPSPAVRFACQSSIWIVATAGRGSGRPDASCHRHLFTLQRLRPQIGIREPAVFQCGDRTIA